MSEKNNLRKSAVKSPFEQLMGFSESQLPPHSIEAEQSVLGGLLLKNEVFDDIAGFLSKQDFYQELHRIVYGAISELKQSEKPFDLVTVADYLKTDTFFGKNQGRDYLAALIKNTPGAANIEHYAHIVKDKSTVRSMIETLQESEQLCRTGGEKDTRKLLDTIESRILQVAEHGVAKSASYKEMPELLESAVNRIDELFNSDGNITGLKTHLNELDEITSGLQNGDLIIVAGRPSMGKTTFSMNIAENAATKNGTPVAVFSMEMPGEQLTNRMISSLGRIDAGRMRTGKLESEDWPKLNKAIHQLQNSKILIDDSAGLSINDLRARARRIDKDVRKKQLEEAKREGEANPESKVTGLGLIVIDYLQLMKGSNNTENRVNEISEISRGLKALAKELNIPVIALSQLNRSLEQRPNKRPIMADLRESGAIEQDADIIIFVYRDEVYHKDTEDKGVAEIILGKHRNGSLGIVRLAFLGEFTRFENLAPQYYEETY